MTDLSASKSTKTSSGPSLLRSASVIALVTIVSKVLGLLRDQMMAHAYGAGMVSDAFNYAFQIPSFALVLLGGLGGPFHTATVSVLSKILKPSEAPTPLAKKVTHTFLSVTSLTFALIAIGVYFAAPGIIEVIAHHASPELKALATEQLRWMSPIIWVGGIIGILYGVANVYDRFFWPSISPSAINITLILWLLFLTPDTAGLALALSTLLGALLQLALQLPDYFKTGFSLMPCLSLRLPEVKTMGELLFPAMVGTTIGQLNIYVAMFFVSQLPAGGWTATQLANRLIQLPIGVLTIAMLVPLFPRFSRFVGEQDFDSLRHQFQQGILSLWLVAFPITTLTILLAEPATRLLFERGAFTPEDTRMVAGILSILALTIVPYILRDGITRVFYAFNDSKTPLWVGLSSIGVNALLNYFLVGPLGVNGIALATLAVTLMNAVLLSVMIRKHLPDMGFQKFWRPLWHMILALGVSSVLGWVVHNRLGILFASLPGFLHTPIGSILDLLSVTLMTMLSYLIALLLLREPLAHQVLEQLKSRLGRFRSEA